MIYPFFEKTSILFQYVIIWLGYAIFQTLTFHSLLSIPIAVLIADGLIHAFIFGILGILLWNVQKYGNFTILSIYQRIVNHVALALITLSLWVGIGFGLEFWIFGGSFLNEFVTVIPVRSFIGLLIYVIIMRTYKPKPQNIDTTEIPENEHRIINDKVSPTEILERVAVKSGTKIHVVLVSEILYLQADGDYVQIFTTNAKYLKEQTMKYFEEHLPVNQFVRVHRSILVNVEMISRIELYEKQNQLLTLKNGQKLKTSPAGYKALRMALNL